MSENNGENANFSPDGQMGLEKNSFFGEQKKSESSLALIAYVFMIITCVAYAVTIVGAIALAWLIPMTLRIKARIKEYHSNSVVLAICTLIFGNLISGILLLCNSEENYK